MSLTVPIPKAKRLRLRGRQMSELREAVFTRDKNVCVDCGVFHTVWNPLQLSHNQPRSLGGEDTPENTAVRCWRCHVKRDGHGQPMHF